MRTQSSRHVRTSIIALLTALAFVAGTLGTGALGSTGATARVRVTHAGPPKMPTYVPKPLTKLPSGRTVDQDYRTVADFNDEMLALANAHPNLVRMFILPERTMEGRSVYGIEITHHVRAKDGKPAFFMMGSIHGNEWPAAEHAIEFARDLVNLNRSDRHISRLLDTLRVTIVPVTNVDGYVHNRRESCHMTDPTGTVFMDRSASAEPACWSATSATAPVDLNRNYPFGWGGAGTTSPAGKGEGPGSEPENQNIMSYVTSHQVTALATNHTSGHTLLWPPLELQAGDTPEDALYEQLAKTLTKQNGYRPLQSAKDYETSGETTDWSYYATRALSYTFEIVTGGSAPAYQDVIDDYLGIGQFKGHPNRNAFFLLAEYAANQAGHAVIRGAAPAGAILTITKDFTLYTGPGGGPVAVPTHLTSTMRVPRSGRFTWGVEPSVRPTPAYREDGVHKGPSGFLRESWTLTCARPSGKVLQTVKVTVDQGDRATVDLSTCARRF